MKSSTNANRLSARFAASALLALSVCLGAPVAMAQTPTKGAVKTAPSANLIQRLGAAEQLKMLGERLTRNWAMTGLGAVRVRAENQFEIDSKRYVRLLKQMQDASDTKELRENYALLGQLWDGFVELHKMGATPDNVKALADQNEELVWIAEKGAQMLRERVGAPQSEGLRLASEARSLSQRMAKLYYFRSLGATAPFIAKDLQTAQKAYLEAIARLRDLSQDKPKAEASLQLVDQQWIFFAEAIAAKPQAWERQATYEQVAKSSDSLLVALEDLSKVFES